MIMLLYSNDGAIFDLVLTLSLQLSDMRFLSEGNIAREILYMSSSRLEESQILRVKPARKTAFFLWTLNFFQWFSSL